MRLPKFKNKKRALVIGGATVIALSASGIAAAYFAASGTGSGSASVAAPTGLHVTVTPVTFKGTGPEHVHFTVMNPNSYKVTAGAVTISDVAGTNCGTGTLSQATGSATVGPLGAGASKSFTGTTTPTITLGTTATTTQLACSVTFKLDVSKTSYAPPDLTISPGTYFETYGGIKSYYLTGTGTFTLGFTLKNSGGTANGVEVVPQGVTISNNTCGTLAHDAECHFTVTNSGYFGFNVDATGKEQITFDFIDYT